MSALSRRHLVKVAAGIVAIVGLQQWRRTGTKPDSAARVLATQIGVRDSVTLSDGTHVVLAPGSRLTVAAGFDGGVRSVTLEGAAKAPQYHFVAPVVK